MTARKTPGMYVPLDVNYARDIAIRKSGPMAELLFLRSMAYSKGAKLNGFVPSFDLEVVGIGLKSLRNCAARLVEFGLWLPVADGWVIRSWYSWNQSTEVEEAFTQGQSDKGKLGNHRRWHEAENVRAPDCKFCQSAIKPDPHPDRNSDPQPDRAPDSPISNKDKEETKKSLVASIDHHPPARPHEPPPTTGPDEPSETARLIAWWKLLYPSDKQPPSKLINDVGRQIKNMLTIDGFPADDIRAGLEAWSKRSNLGASLLPNIVHEIRNPPHANGRPRNQTETEDWLTEAMERAIQIDASKAQQRTEITA